MKWFIFLVALFLLVLYPLNAQIIRKEVILQDTSFKGYFKTITKTNSAYLVGASFRKKLSIDEDNHKLEYYFGAFKFQVGDSIEKIMIKKRDQFFEILEILPASETEFDSYEFNYPSDIKYLFKTRFDSRGYEVFTKKYEKKPIYTTSAKSILLYKDSIFIARFDLNAIWLRVYDSNLDTCREFKIMDISDKTYINADNIKVLRTDKGFFITGLLIKKSSRSFFVLTIDNNYIIKKSYISTQEDAVVYLSDIIEKSGKLYCVGRYKPLLQCPYPEKLNFIKIINNECELEKEINFMPNEFVLIMKAEFSNDNSIYLAYENIQKQYTDPYGMIITVFDFGFGKINLETEELKNIRWGKTDLSSVPRDFLILDQNNILLVGEQDNQGYIALLDFGVESAKNELSSSAISISPNPAGDFITLTLKPSEGSEIQIYNTLGEKVMTTLARHAVPLQVNISDLPKGIYIVKVGGETAKFVKL